MKKTFISSIGTILIILVSMFILSCSDNKSTPTQPENTTQTNPTSNKSGYGVGVENPTGDYWFDEIGNSKMIYRKVVKVNLPIGDGSLTNTPHGIDLNTLDRVISIRGTFKSTAYTHSARTLPWVSATPAMTIDLALTDSNINLRSSYNWASYGKDAVVIVEYIKK